VIGQGCFKDHGQIPSDYTLCKQDFRSYQQPNIWLDWWEIMLLKYSITHNRSITGKCFIAAFIDISV